MVNKPMVKKTKVIKTTHDNYYCDTCGDEIGQYTTKCDICGNDICRDCWTHFENTLTAICSTCHAEHKEEFDEFESTLHKLDKTYSEYHNKSRVAKQEYDDKHQLLLDFIDKTCGFV